LLLTKKTWACNSVLVQSPKHSCCKALGVRKVDPLDIEVVWLSH